MSLAIPDAVHAYRGNSTINFVTNPEKGLSVTIETDRLFIRSVEATEEDYARYTALFGDKVVMQQVAAGVTKTETQTKTRVNGWAQRWFDANPYSGLAVFEKNTAKFVGHIILGYGDRAGEAEFAGLGFKEFWNRGYGKEAATAILKEYAPATVKEGYLAYGTPLTKIVATAKPDNFAAVNILGNLMHYDYQTTKYEELRNYYSINLNEQQEQTSKKVSNSWCSIL